MCVTIPTEEHIAEDAYLMLAYYLICPLENPQAEVKAHKAFLSQLDVRARIYISEQGINGQMSASSESAKQYMEWMRNHPSFANVVFKLQPHHEHAFPRLTVKYRKELVAVGIPVDLTICGEHISPEEWKQRLDRDPHSVVLDVRNRYEWEVGRFEHAEPPPCDSFRDFPAYANALKERLDPETTPIMMYCTGGIRCEFFSSLLLQAGFKKVYQLDGGVIQYGERMGNTHWLGKLFVFDDRLTVPLSKTVAHLVVGTCHLCQVPAEDYYNCANMDCNKLFLCCKECITAKQGCCQSSCQEAPRRRPHQHVHKPFRRWYNYIEAIQAPPSSPKAAE